MGEELRIFGPPGCGKTTALSGSVKATAKARGTSRIVVGSFTRAASIEIAGRGLGLPRDQVGTLHALAYRAIDRPPIAQTELADWNQTHPAFALREGFRDLDEPILPGAGEKGALPGDLLLAETEIMRARMVPREHWRHRAVQFIEHWDEWKNANGLVDFTDMIEGALTRDEPAPGEPVVGFFDEAQDFTKLELSLVRHWGSFMERLILAGDDDQCIYAFKGAMSDAFLDPPLPDEQKRFLHQSYRVPRAVHAVSQQWVERLSRREPKQYEPRDEEGEVSVRGFRWDSPQPLILDVERQVAAGRSVMVLTTCAYMLDRVKATLRDAGLPFANPYRRSRRDWNPLASNGRGVSTVDRVLAYLMLDERIFGERARPWTGEDVRRWAGLIKKSGTFVRGAEGRLKGLPDRELTYGELTLLFDDAADLDAILEPSLDWLAAHLTAGAMKTAQFPIRVAQLHGPTALEVEPLCTIGTTHSVKGGEADVVYLFTDVSPNGWREWSRPSTRDSVIRQMYVGMTRAREELIVCHPVTSYAVPTNAILGL